MKNTIVISAYPACGKSYFFKHMQDKYSVLDSDSSKFSWKMVDGEKVRDENFPNNYIDHIKENIGKVDIIFVSSHLVVRQAMTDSSIPFFTVYPEHTLLNEWVGRMYRRGNDKAFIDFQIANWDKFTNENILEEEPHGIDYFLLKSNGYITEEIITAIKMLYDSQINEEIERLWKLDALMDYAEGKIG